MTVPSATGKSRNVKNWSSTVPISWVRSAAASFIATSRLRLRQLCPPAATGQWVANSPWETALAGTGAAALTSPNAEANAALRGQVQVLAVLSQAEIPLPDPVAYRRDWATYRVRLTFGTPPSELESRELAAPAPPPQPAAPPPTPVPSG